MSEIGIDGIGEYGMEKAIWHGHGDYLKVKKRWAWRKLGAL